MNIQLAKLLVKKDVVSVDQIRTAIERQNEYGYELSESLINLGYIEEGQLVDILSKEYSVPTFDLQNYQIEEYVINLIPGDTAKEHCLIPVSTSNSILTVAMSDPSNILLQDDLSFLTGCAIKSVLASERSIKDKIKLHYGGDELDSAQNMPEELQDEDIDQMLQVKPVSNGRSVEDIIRELEDFQKDQLSSKELTDNAVPSEYSIESESDGVSNEVSLNQQGTQHEPDVITLDKDHEIIETATQEKVYIASEPDNAQGAIHSVDQKHADSYSSDNDENRGFPTSVGSQEHEADVITLDTDTKDRSDSEEIVQSPVSDFTGQAAQDEPQETLNSEETVVSGGFESSLSSEPHKDENEVAGVVPVGEGVQGNPFESSESSVSDNVSEDQSNEEGEHNLIGFNSPPESDPITSELVREVELSTKQELSIEEDPSTQDVDDGYNSIEADLTELSLTVEHEDPVSEDVDANATTHATQPVELNQSQPEPEQSTNDEQRIDDEVDRSEVRQDVNPPSENRNIETDTSHALRDNNVREENSEVRVVNNQKPAGSTVPQDSKSIDDGKTSVLVIDDSPTVQKIVTITLEKKGYKVISAADAMEALSCLNDMKPDLIFLDINLPHMDGYQLCKIIKSHGLTKDVPIVMLSGKDGFFDKVRGRMVGAKDYITKPFESSVLISAVEKYTK